MKSRRIDAALFALLLGLLWIGLSFAVSLSQTETALIAGGFLLLATVVVLISRGSEDGKSKLAKWWRGVSYRGKVNILAAIVAIAAGVGAGVLLLPEPNPDKGECPAQNGQSACPTPGETTTKTTQTSESGTGKDGKSSKKGKTTVVEEKTSVAEPDESLLGRAVDNQAGVIILRLGLALLAAFTAGLVTQRIALGKYGVKLPFGMGEFEEISDEKAKAVTEQAKEDPALKTALEISKGEGDGFDLTSPGDTRIQLVAVRNDVEEELRSKAEGVEGVDELAPINLVIDGLSERQVIGPNARSALRDMIEIGDRAAQGATIEPGVRSWLVEEGQYLPGAIDQLQA